MNKKIHFFFFIPAILLIAIVSIKRLNASEKSNKIFDKIVLQKVLSQLIKFQIEKRHFNRPKIDDTVSKKWFNNYFETLDPRKLYFYQKDLNSFANYYYKLDDFLKTGDFSFAKNVYTLYLTRITEKVALTKKLLKKTLNFTKDETLLYNREDATWFKNKEEAYETWRKITKNNLLVKNLAQEKNHKDFSKKKHAKTPIESIIKDQENKLKFAKEFDQYDVLEIYINSLTKLFDPHSNYWSFRSAEDFQINITLSLQGIGATLTIEDGYTKVVSLIIGGPAQKQGDLHAGDYITEVTQEDGKTINIINMPIKKVVRHIRGKKGTTVHLGIQTPTGTQKQISIIRDEVKLEDSAVSGEVKEITTPNGKYRIGYIYLPSFYADWRAKQAGEKNYRSCSRDTQKLIEQFKKNGQLDGIILDLRGNGGGDLNEAINLSGLFIPKGPIVQVKDANNFLQTREDKNPFFYDLPLITLIDHFSASASEIFAGAIQDYKRGIIVGDIQTHGKGTVQSVHQLNKYNPRLRNYKLGSIKFTVAKFYRITGASTQRRGIIPDIIFPSFADSFKSSEKDLDNALIWDEIKPVTFTETNYPFFKKISKLKENLKKRLKSNYPYQTRLNKIKQYDKIINEKYISLKKNTRQAAQIKREKWSTLISKVLFGHIPRSNTKDEKKIINDITDYKLAETYSILVDILQLKTQ